MGAKIEDIELIQGCDVRPQRAVASAVHQTELDPGHLSGEGIAEEDHQDDRSEQDQADGAPISFQLTDDPQGHNPHPLWLWPFHAPSERRKKASSSLGSDSLISRGDT